MTDYVRIHFQDYRCEHCGRMLFRANLEDVGAALPAGFAAAHPLAAMAMRSVKVEIRCPKCSIISTFGLEIDDAERFPHANVGVKHA